MTFLEKLIETQKQERLSVELINKIHERHVESMVAMIRLRYERDFYGLGWNKKPDNIKSLSDNELIEDIKKYLE